MGFGQSSADVVVLLKVYNIAVLNIFHYFLSFHLEFHILLCNFSHCSNDLSLILSQVFEVFGNIFSICSMRCTLQFFLTLCLFLSWIRSSSFSLRTPGILRHSVGVKVFCILQSPGAVPFLQFRVLP